MTEKESKETSGTKTMLGEQEYCRLERDKESKHGKN